MDHGQGNGLATQQNRFGARSPQLSQEKPKKHVLLNIKIIWSEVFATVHQQQTQPETQHSKVQIHGLLPDSCGCLHFTLFL